MTYQFLDAFFIVLTLAVPIVLLIILKRMEKHVFLNYMLAGSALLLVFMALTGWWTDYSTSLRLSELGYREDALGMLAFAEVSAENRAQVDKLLRSSYGIGWPVKVLIGYVALGIPYLFTVYVIKFAIHSLTSADDPVEP